jgi:hypothetical protein
MLHRGHQCGNVDARRDNDIKLLQMFITVRMNITDDQGSRACLMYTGENSLHSRLAWASGSVLPLQRLGYCEPAGCRARLLQ